MRRMRDHPGDRAHAKEHNANSRRCRLLRLRPESSLRRRLGRGLRLRLQPIRRIYLTLRLPKLLGLQLLLAPSCLRLHRLRLRLSTVVVDLPVACNSPACRIVTEPIDPRLTQDLLRPRHATFALLLSDCGPCGLSSCFFPPLPLPFGGCMQNLAEWIVLRNSITCPGMA